MGTVTSRPLSKSKKKEITNAYIKDWLVESKFSKKYLALVNEILDTADQLSRIIYPDWYALPETLKRIIEAVTTNNTCFMVWNDERKSASITSVSYITRHYYSSDIVANTLGNLRNEAKTIDFPFIQNYKLTHYRDQLSAGDLTPTKFPTVPSTNRRLKKIQKLDIKVDTLEKMLVKKANDIDAIMKTVRSTKQLSAITNAFEKYYPHQSTASLPVPIEVIKSLKPIEEIKV